MDDSINESWKKFLNPETLKSNLIISSIYITVFEISKESIISRLKDFYSTGFDINGPIVSTEYKKKVLAKDKSPLYASLMWLKENKVINEHDLEDFEEIKNHRNELAHEMINFISNEKYNIKIELFNTLINLIHKIEKWWIVNVEIATDPDLYNKEIDEKEIVPGITMSIKLLTDIALGLEKEAGYYYNNFKAREKA